MFDEIFISTTKNCYAYNNDKPAECPSSVRQYKLLAAILDLNYERAI